ncbi:MAG: 4Fe-4S binding protein [Firmicutes bacterium]|nr:4Fe-4S binding protein [Bacillota bacterium]
MLQNYDSNAPILGLTKNADNQEIKSKAFDFIIDCGSLFFASTDQSGKPNIRGLEVHRLDEEGNVYFGLSTGKPSYTEIKEQNFIAASAFKSLPLDSGGYSIAIRVYADLEEMDSPLLMERYWQQNPGTKEMYKKDLSNFALFKLKNGYGEFFHVRKDEKIFRLRFSFGQGKIRPFLYHIEDNCIECGLCAESCLMDTILVKDGHHYIDHYSCLECGKCYQVCPTDAISKASQKIPL